MAGESRVRIYRKGAITAIVSVDGTAESFVAATDLTATYAPGTRAITGVSTTAKTFTIAGNHLKEFPAARRLYVGGSTGNDGWYTVVEAHLSSTNTIIRVSQTVASAVADGTIANELYLVAYGAGGNSGVWQIAKATYSSPNTTIYIDGNVTNAGASGGLYAPDYITLEWCAADPVYNQPGAIILDRLGLEHVVSPTDSTELQRFVNRLTLAVDTEDADLCSIRGLRLDEFINTYCILANDELEIFVHEDSYDQLGDARSVMRCYKGHLGAVPSGLMGLLGGPEGSAQDTIGIELLCDADGTFTSFTNVTTASYRTRP